MLVESSLFPLYRILQFMYFRVSLPKMVSIPTSLGFGDRLPTMPSLPSFNLASLPSFSSTVLSDGSPGKEPHGV